MKRFLLIVLFYYLAPIGLHGQALGIGKSGLMNFPDTTAQGNNVNFNLYVRNTGLQAFSGQFSLKFSVNSVAQSSPLYSGYVTALQPGDSTLISINGFHIANAVFNKFSNNIVVVWPRAQQSTPTSDSGTVVVYVTDSVQYFNFTSGIGPAGVSRQISVFPNPASEGVFLSGPALGQIARIDLVDPCTGRSLFTTDNSAYISLSYLKSGCYFLYVTLHNQQRIFLKFIKD